MVEPFDTCSAGGISVEGVTKDELIFTGPVSTSKRTRLTRRHANVFITPCCFPERPVGKRLHPDNMRKKDRLGRAVTSSQRERKLCLVLQEHRNTGQVWLEVSNVHTGGASREGDIMELLQIPRELIAIPTPGAVQ